MQFQPGRAQNVVWEGVDLDFGFLGKERVLHHPTSNKSTPQLIRNLGVSCNASELRRIICWFVYESVALK